MSSPPFREAHIARLEPAARDQSLLALEHDPVLEAAYTRPGQYCQLRLEDGEIEGHFVLVDPPGAGPFRFLLRSGGPAADALRTKQAGARLDVRGPLGEGFDLDKARDRDVLLVSAGSAIGAIRPVLLALRPYGARRIWLYHGTRTLEHVPFLDDLERSEREGVALTITVSRAGKSQLSERVQHAIRRDRLDLRHAVAYVSGMHAMVEALRIELPRLGLAPEAIYLNY
jgi:NAD(P)H-flavin reductase